MTTNIIKNEKTVKNTETAVITETTVVREIEKVSKTGIITKTVQTTTSVRTAPIRAKVVVELKNEIEALKAEIAALQAEVQTEEAVQVVGEEAVQVVEEEVQVVEEEVQVVEEEAVQVVEAEAVQTTETDIDTAIETAVQKGQLGGFARYANTSQKRNMLRSIKHPLTPDYLQFDDEVEEEVVQEETEVEAVPTETEVEAVPTEMEVEAVPTETEVEAVPTEAPTMNLAQTLRMWSVQHVRLVQHGEGLVASANVQTTNPVTLSCDSDEEAVVRLVETVHSANWGINKKMKYSEEAAVRNLLWYLRNEPDFIQKMDEHSKKLQQREIAKRAGMFK